MKPNIFIKPFLNNKCSRIRRDLWPWRDWMTIGISAICSYKKPQDCIVLASDKLGSFGDELSTRRLAKMFIQGEHDAVFAVCADSVENAGELVGTITEEWRKLPARYYANLRESLQHAVNRYRKYRFRLDVLPNYPLGMDEDWRLAAEKLGLTQTLLDAWQNCPLGCDLLVGTFDAFSQAHVYDVPSVGQIHAVNQPGFSVIGSGAYNAQFWLSYREQSS